MRCRVILLVASSTPWARENWKVPSHASCSVLQGSASPCHLPPHPSERRRTTGSVAPTFRRALPA
eukprot:8683494-Pyramimonas_sp.AAC.1